MGRLVTAHSCPVCNYFIEDDLSQGGSGISPMFLRNHYALAICRNCRNLVSTLVANNDQQMTEALANARSEIVQMEADAVVGDMRARDLLPLFREALDSFEADMAGEVSLCSVCGSTDLDLYDDVNVKDLDAQDAWLPCPRCEEGRLLVETTGSWD